MDNPNSLTPIKKSDKINLWTINDFVNDSECLELIKEASKKGYIGSAVQNSKDTSKMNMKTSARSSETAFVGSADSSEIKSLFGDRAKEALKSVGVSNIYDLKMEGLQVQKYEQGQKYNPHYDTFADKDGSEQRSWTVMVYLNEKDLEKGNELEGGSTYFPNIDLRVHPKKGMAVVWNNLDENFCRDKNTLHTGTEVNRGTKIVVTMWFRKPTDKKFLCKTGNFHNPGKDGKFTGSEVTNVTKMVDGFFTVDLNNLNPLQITALVLFIFLLFGFIAYVFTVLMNSIPKKK
jgi:prolyl 4-hydroxylase